MYVCMYVCLYVCISIHLYEYYIYIIQCYIAINQTNSGQAPISSPAQEVWPKAFHREMPRQPGKQFEKGFSFTQNTQLLKEKCAGRRIPTCPCHGPQANE